MQRLLKKYYEKEPPFKKVSLMCELTRIWDVPNLSPYILQYMTIKNEEYHYGWIINDRMEGRHIFICAYCSYHWIFTHTFAHRKLKIIERNTLSEPITMICRRNNIKIMSRYVGDEFNYTNTELWRIIYEHVAPLNCFAKDHQ